MVASAVDDVQVRGRVHGYGFFGAEVLALSSASSKTAYGTAFLLREVWLEVLAGRNAPRIGHVLTL